MQELLRELEQFAFQGCGNQMTYDTAASGENVRKLQGMNLLVSPRMSEPPKCPNYWDLGD